MMAAAAAGHTAGTVAPALVGVVRCVADQPGACTNGEALLYRLAFQLSAAAAIAAVLALTLADVAGGEGQLAEFGVLAVGALALGDLRRRLVVNCDAWRLFGELKQQDRWPRAGFPKTPGDI
jgi:hypothetical protein